MAVHPPDRAKRRGRQTPHFQDRKDLPAVDLKTADPALVCASSRLQNRAQRSLQSSLGDRTEICRCGVPPEAHTDRAFGELIRDVHRRQDQRAFDLSA
mgnify:CR=1 FL=1